MTIKLNSSSTMQFDCHLTSSNQYSYCTSYINSSNTIVTTAYHIHHSWQIHEQQEQQEKQQELQTKLKPSDERDWDIVAAARKGFAANTLTADDRLQSLAELLPPEACKIPWRDSKGRRYRIEPTRIFCKTTSKTNHGDQLPVRLVQSFLLSKNS